jgi:hypothetical protein
MEPPSESGERSDCIVQHSPPPEEIGKYSTVRDPASEDDIAQYVQGQARDETIQHVEKIKTEYVLGDPYEIWDVVTDKTRWWVITNLTNLYSQQYFPSLDYTLSFHIGLMMRIRSRPRGPDASEPDPFDEVFRRKAQAEDRLERAIEVHDYQSVGMQLRECLISLVAVLRRRTEVEIEGERPKDADFVHWIEIIYGKLCGGGKNKELRSYLTTTAQKTWQLVNWLTHDRDANECAASISTEAVGVLVGHSIQLFMREKTDNVQTCPLCQSRDIRSHYDPGIEPDGDYFSTCGQCNWSTHPKAHMVELRR